jgi:hypothetical protein
VKTVAARQLSAAVFDFAKTYHTERLVKDRYIRNALFEFRKVNPCSFFAL